MSFFSSRVSPEAAPQRNTSKTASTQRSAGIQAPSTWSPCPGQHFKDVKKDVKKLIKIYESNTADLKTQLRTTIATIPKERFHHVVKHILTYKTTPKQEDDKVKFIKELITATKDMEDTDFYSQILELNLEHKEGKDRHQYTLDLIKSIQFLPEKTKKATIKILTETELDLALPESTHKSPATQTEPTPIADIDEPTLDTPEENTYKINLSGKKVLFVDDISAIRRTFERLLKNNTTTPPPSLTTAADGYEALLSVIKEKPDVVVLDNEMPGMDGPTFNIIFQKLFNGTIPVIVATGDPSTNKIKDTTITMSKPNPDNLKKALAHIYPDKVVETEKPMRNFTFPSSVGKKDTQFLQPIQPTRHCTSSGLKSLATEINNSNIAESPEEQKKKIQARIYDLQKLINKTAGEIDYKEEAIGTGKSITHYISSASNMVENGILSGTLHENLRTAKNYLQHALTLIK